MLNCFRSLSLVFPPFKVRAQLGGRPELAKDPEFREQYIISRSDGTDRTDSSALIAK